MKGVSHLDEETGKLETEPLNLNGSTAVRYDFYATLVYAPTSNKFYQDRAESSSNSLLTRASRKHPVQASELNLY